LQVGGPFRKRVAIVNTTTPAIARPDRDGRGPLAGALVLVTVGLVLRLVTVSDLWLDEALSVNIAKLPLVDIPAALGRDGHPPLYYVLLHLWISVVGDGDLAVRSLSGVASVVTLPVVWLVGHRLGGRRAAWGAAFVLAVNPFAIRYATETRMYALVVLEVSLGLLAALRALERPSVGRLAWVAVTAAALLYTHYWALYLLTATGIVLAVMAWKRTSSLAASREGAPGQVWRERLLGPEARLLAAFAVGAAAWAPWIPTFLDQAAHTATPWAPTVSPWALITAMGEFGGGNGESGRVLSLLLASLVVVGLLGRALGGSRIELDLRGRPPARPLFAILIGCPALAVVLGLATGSAFAGRYASMVLPFFASLAGLGVAVVGDRRRLTVTLGAVGLIGLGLAGQNAFRNRTQAGELAGYVTAAAKPGDVIAFCPDQLGPATLRLLGTAFPSIGFPRGDDARRIDWYDYQAVNRATSPSAFAKVLDQRAGTAHDVWLVSSHGYRTAVTSCTELENRLLAVRPGGRQVVRAKPGKYFEDAALIRYPSGAPAAA